MDFKEFHNLPMIRKKDKEDIEKGIEPIYIRDGINSQINLGKTRAEIKNTLTSLLPGLDEETLEAFTNEAMEQQIEKSQLQEFAQNKQSALKIESIDTSAIEEKAPEKDSFIQKVETPTLNSTSKNLDRSEVTNDKDDKEEGQEI